MRPTHAYRLIIGYDGTDFHGWQENEGVRTVQGVLSRCVSVIAAGDVEVEGSSRTDTGVHALGHLVRIRLCDEVDPDKFQRSLQGVTPADIQVVSCQPAAPDWHPRFDAIGKRYLYRIWNSQLPPLFGSSTHWWIRQQLDHEQMQRAAVSLVGRHDFAAYRTRSKDEKEDTVRTIHQIAIERWGETVTIQVVGDGFLYRMVRNLVGTLSEVGRGHREVEDPARILASTDRRNAGIAAPPEGLFLVEVACRGESLPECSSGPMLL